MARLLVVLVGSLLTTSCAASSTSGQAVPAAPALSVPSTGESDVVEPAGPSRPSMTTAPGAVWRCPDALPTAAADRLAVTHAVLVDDSVGTHAQRCEWSDGIVRVRYDASAPQLNTPRSVLLREVWAGETAGATVVWTDADAAVILAAPPVGAEAAFVEAGNGRIVRVVIDNGPQAADEVAVIAGELIAALRPPR